MPKEGLLLLNLGTPDSPEPGDVGKYLREFLSDPLVIDIPRLARWFLVNVLIIPRRKRASSELYKKVWMEKGSPLFVYTKELAEKMKAKHGQNLQVDFAMRYGNPSIMVALKKFQALGIEKVTVFPLYPQYSQASTESCIEKTKAVLAELNYSPMIRFIPPFFDSESFLDAFAELGRPYVARRDWDKILFSYHGLPERQIKRIESCAKYCKFDDVCCSNIEPANQKCYRAQCYATTQGIASRLGLAPHEYEICFQSRLGTTPWIRPFTDERYTALAKEGKKRLLVFSPSFVADCLETLEEIAIRGDKQFREEGGEKVTLVPSLNATDAWVEAVTKISLPA